MNEPFDVLSSAPGNTEDLKMIPKPFIKSSPQNLKVLVAEDNPTNLKIAQLILKPLADVVDIAEDGSIAFEKFKANKYDVVFMDIIMPEMDGFETTKCIRDFENENGLVPVKIVAMTANAMKEDAELCLRSGMDNYLSKPFKRETMVSIIESLYNINGL